MKRGTVSYHVEGGQDRRGSVMRVVEPGDRLTLGDQQSGVEPLPHFRPTLRQHIRFEQLVKRNTNNPTSNRHTRPT